MEVEETNEKKYYNPRLQKILRQYITRAGYGDFTTILKDIFQRRAYEFGFSEDQMEREVANFVKNVRSIGFVSKEEMPTPYTMGLYMPVEDEIRINQDYYLSQVEETPELNFGTAMFGTLTHEVYHAITDTGTQLGLMYIEDGEWVRSSFK